MIKAFSSVLCIGLCCYTLGQISISGGTGILNGIGKGFKPVGFHIGIDVPRSSDLTFYARAAAFLPAGGKETYYENMTAILQTTSPYTTSVPYQKESNTYYFEGGTRSFILNDYDNGFGIYGGSVVGVGINQTRKEYEDYDYMGVPWEGKYLPSSGDERKGNYYYLALGIQGGMKYTIPIRGTIYFDMTGTYSVLGFANNFTGNSSLTYSPLNFLFSLGYRRDLY